MAVTAGVVEKDCDDMEFRRWMERNALLEGRRASIVMIEAPIFPPASFG